MAEELHGDDVRGQSFAAARRGYARGEVDSFRQAAARRIDELEEQLDVLEGQLRQVGLEEPKDVATELDAVGAEVSRILQEARTAAEQMRGRASADAARWRAEADTESRRVRDEAAADSQSVRRDAWETGTELLEQAVSERGEIEEAARQDALFIRAEAEREALRLTAHARRERDEAVRGAREEAERLLATARQESDTILESARHQAETAQERARALEERRAELMAELEAARASIGELEEEIEARETDAASDAAEALEVPEVTWTDEDGAVRIVSSQRVLPSEPVDALKMAAEVQALRERLEAEPTAVAEPSEPPEIQEEVAVADAAASDIGEPQPPAEAVETDGAESEAAVEAAEEPVVTLGAPQAAELDSLFDNLRDTVASPILEEPAASPMGNGPRAEAVATLTKPKQGSVAVSTDGAADLRDRLLLPVQNRALRGIKRELLDLQGLVLEEVRADASGWQPDTAQFATAFTGELAVLAEESRVAGYAAAAELAGAEATPQPQSAAAVDPTPEFVAGLIEMVESSLRRSLESGAAGREAGAAVSRVFRAWRTDEAERRVRLASGRAYHRGFLDALPELGVERVVGVAVGRTCPECPAARGEAWPVTSEIPGALPPALDRCACTLAPAVDLTDG